VPVNFLVVALQVPDETNVGIQNVALYRTSADPTTLPSITPIFIQTGVPSSQRIVLPTPQMYQVGDWFSVLGACGTATGNMENSYGAATPYPSRVLGMPIQLSRLMLQAHIVPSQGIGQVYTNTASFARVRVYVVGQGEALSYGTGGGANPPSLLVSDPNPPSIGFTGAMLAKPGSANNSGGVLALGTAMSNVPTPFGPLLNLPQVVHLPIPGPIPSAGTLISLSIPKDPTLLGLNLYFQHAEVQGTTLSLGNGIAWGVGQ
jgi:hypothetical protein